jgi:hypothetical protein
MPLDRRPVLDRLERAGGGYSLAAPACTFEAVRGLDVSSLPACAASWVRCRMCAPPSRLALARLPKINRERDCCVSALIGSGCRRCLMQADFAQDAADAVLSFRKRAFRLLPILALQGGSRLLDRASYIVSFNTDGRSVHHTIVSLPAPYGE